mmetsp:Transcript_59985/g.70084  ORF Transcript_59985/g.70084 Transcript_59985/m.70084 type:complete len:302 (-) Transcript_59985:114-1019(-)
MNMDDYDCEISSISNDYSYLSDESTSSSYDSYLIQLLEQISITTDDDDTTVTEKDKNSVNNAYAKVINEYKNDETVILGNDDNCDNISDNGSSADESAIGQNDENIILSNDDDNNNGSISSVSDDTEEKLEGISDVEGHNAEDNDDDSKTSEIEYEGMNDDDSNELLIDNIDVTINSNEKDEMMNDDNNDNNYYNDDENDDNSPTLSSVNKVLVENIPAASALSKDLKAATSVQDVVALSHIKVDNGNGTDNDDDSSIVLRPARKVAAPFLCHLHFLWSFRSKMKRHCICLLSIWRTRPGT